MWVYYYSALIHVQFGEIDDVLSALKWAIELEYQRELLWVDPVLAEFREDERFVRLVSNSNP